MQCLLYRCESIIHFDPEVYSGLILVSTLAGRQSLAEYNNWDPIEFCERTKLAVGEDGMIRSELLIYEARTQATRGCVGRVSQWVEFYTHDNI